MFILGAADPEMSEIEGVLRNTRREFGYAGLNGSRVAPGTAYKAVEVIPVQGSPGGEMVFVECAVDGVLAARVIDHHRPGDPGYGAPPERYLEASSLGQLLQLLGLDADRRQRIIAAADHCLFAAYAGRCPGVDPDDLLEFRLESRAAFQKRSVEELKLAVASTIEALKTANRVELSPGIIVADMRRDVPYDELPEAAARAGVGYLSGPLVGPDGRKKYTVSGPPEAVRGFMETWAPAQGLLEVYGDPARGFAGGYLP